MIFLKRKPVLNSVFLNWGRVFFAVKGKNVQSACWKQITFSLTSSLKEFSSKKNALDTLCKSSFNTILFNFWKVSEVILTFLLSSNQVLTLSWLLEIMDWFMYAYLTYQIRNQVILFPCFIKRQYLLKRSPSRLLSLSQMSVALFIEFFNNLPQFCLIILTLNFGTHKVIIQTPF